jgi:hypothetical protein
MAFEIYVINNTVVLELTIYNYPGGTRAGTLPVDTDYATGVAISQL